ncbi:MAG TPA: tyrosine-type recombinase/integrase [Candidatus Competibacteraceae bacterium]|nr:tyrosine-type recombinase/integrase [Candidatus Competibacteraceae bacterium]HSA45380.1 tyrosine-type recombinase/integrase [Candidatus Competibacteraceae bacterium]
MAMTDTQLKALKPRAKSYILTDSDGLYVEVIPTGGICWRYRYRLHGKQEKVSLGRYPDLTLKAARQKRAELAALVAQGQSPARQKQRTKAELQATLTVREFAAQWMKDVVQRVRKNSRTIELYLESDILPAIGDRRLRDVTATDAQVIVFRKRDAGREKAAAMLRGILKRLFDYAMAQTLIDNNPIASLPTRFITTMTSRDRALEPAEIRTFLIELYQSNIARRSKLALHLLLLTLVRKGELTRARWEHVHFDTAEWFIPPENSKTEKPHIVYLSHQAIELFRELHLLAGDSAWVLPGRVKNQPLSDAALNHAVDGVNFSIPQFTIHDLRRTASTRLNEMGYAGDVIEKALNHTQVGVRGIYNRAEYREQRQTMLQFWSDWVVALIDERAILAFNFRKTS